MKSEEHQPSRAVRLVLDGRVQGVGFRPFVYRLALRHGLQGWVCNRLGEVEIRVQGDAAAIAAFRRDLLEQAPPLAQPRLRAEQALPLEALQGFEIRASHAEHPARIHLPPDYFACADCIAEIQDPGQRRYRYPFTNCTQCGPRYTLIRALPYDRPNTALAGFPLCADCAAEYHNPADRRFHAEPLACPACGPQLGFAVPGKAVIHNNEDALRAAVNALRQQAVLAIKGVGGYHLVCDAGNDAAIAALRTRKQRPHKPLAVMFPARGTDGLDAVRASVELDEAAQTLLQDPARPIVLARRREDCPLSHLLAPGLRELGVMLPYSPLHHLLLSDFDAPLVMTSGNLSGEPVLTGNDEAERRLAGIADAFLHHDRPIVRPADDSVYRASAGRLRPLRLGRGTAPLERELITPVAQPTLAVGAHLKNTIALAWDDRVVISPHIGDMGTRRSLEVFTRLVEDLQQLYRVRAERLVCDAHPDYSSSRWARDAGLPLQRVLHHHAHASALAGEWALDTPSLVFTWDGTGLGDAQQLWGGEAFLGRPGQWRRVASLRPFRLPGGEKSGREPWRSAAALCWETGLTPPFLPAQADLAHQAWQRGVQAPWSSAAGRLFDAAASLLDITQQASFEAQGPMQLEAMATEGQAIPLPLRRHEGVMELDWAPLLPHLLDARRSVAQRAADLHLSLAQGIRAQALALAQQHEFQQIGLCGGVFQNARLAGLSRDALEAAGFRVFIPEALPLNDAAISFGQIIESAAQPPHRT
ncbi:MAG: carbamoyltransferase HypF [Gammaproteobacteria bacterium]